MVTDPDNPFLPPTPVLKIKCNMRGCELRCEEKEMERAGWVVASYGHVQFHFCKEHAEQFARVATKAWDAYAVAVWSMGLGLRAMDD
jgi:hypothetical protein